MNMRKRVTRCPACERPLQVTELSCPNCDLRIRGHFERGCKFCALDPEQQRLLDVFLSSRGVIREMEKALGLSYPTVRARVNSLLTALGYTPTEEEAAAQEDVAQRRREIFDRLEADKITPDEAVRSLKDLAR